MLTRLAALPLPIKELAAIYVLGRCAILVR